MELREKEKRIEEEHAEMKRLRNMEQKEQYEAFVEDINMKYRQAEKESHTQQSDSLLLPIQMQSEKAVSQSLTNKGLKLSNIERTAIVAEVENDKRAELNALLYHNLAERLKREKRELNDTLNRKIEIVQDFWRNQLCEGSSRMNNTKCFISSFSCVS